MRRGAIALAAALLACGCGGGDDDDDELGAPPRYRIPGCEQYETSPCDVLDSQCQTRLFGLAACLRGGDPGTLPPVSIMTEAQYGDYLRMRASLEDPTPNLDKFEQAFVRLALVAPGAFSVESETAAAAASVLGVYRFEMKDIVVINHGGDPDPELASSTLVHEFVHALQDQESDLAAFGDGLGTTFDATSALTAVVEGEARFQETRFDAALQGLDPRSVDWPRAFQDRVDYAEAWMVAEDSPLLAAGQVFPYEWGARYTNFDWDATGHQGVLARFGSPPTTTRTYIASADQAAPDGFAPLTIEAPTAPAEWTLLGDDALGALGLLLEFGTLTELEHARALALTWRADGLAVYANDADVAVVWSVELADDASATDAAALLGGRLGPSNVRVVGTRVVAAGSSSGSSVSWALPPP